MSNPRWFRDGTSSALREVLSNTRPSYQEIQKLVDYGPHVSLLHYKISIEPFRELVQSPRVSKIDSVLLPSTPHNINSLDVREFGASHLCWIVRLCMAVQLQ